MRRGVVAAASVVLAVVAGCGSSCPSTTGEFTVTYFDGSGSAQVNLTMTLPLAGSIEYQHCTGATCGTCCHDGDATSATVYGEAQAPGIASIQPSGDPACPGDTTESVSITTSDGRSTSFVCAQIDAARNDPANGAAFGKLVDDLRALAATQGQRCH